MRMRSFLTPLLGSLQGGMLICSKCQGAKTIEAFQFRGRETQRILGSTDTAPHISTPKRQFASICSIIRSNLVWGRVWLLKRGEVQLPENQGEALPPKEGWLQRQFELAQKEVKHRPELRARASQFANERGQRSSNEGSG